MSDWINDLKENDKVIISTNKREYISTVKRLTKTQIVVEKFGYKFNRKTGDLVGGDIWSTVYLKQATDDEIKRINENNRKKLLLIKIEKFNFNELCIDDLEAIVCILSK